MPKTIPKVMRRSTLKDVARAAGVSPASVSRALASKGAVSPGLHARIMAAAARLEYEPNLAARALASRHSGLLAMVVSPTDDGVVVRSAAAALRALDRHGYSGLLVSETMAGHADIAALAKRGVEAVLFVGRAPLQAHREALSWHRLAWVCITDAEGENACHVDLGRIRAVELACRYLQQVGHQRLAVLASSGLALDPLVSRLRDEGATIELVRVGLRGDPVTIGGALGRLLEPPGFTTAVVCADDLTAWAVIREGSIRGISIPRDLAVVGFGDEPFARCGRPSLTTVRPAYGELGDHAAEAVLDVFAGRSRAPYTPTIKLIVRETTERPGNRGGSTWNDTRPGST